MGPVLRLSGLNLAYAGNLEAFRSWAVIPQRLTSLNSKETKIKDCGERGSNTRPSDLQSDALPTELSPLNGCFCLKLY
uniref:Uncharacterized protein n=1 Tax=Manihot esculenta TaxID=3983 RepID=A0A2C9VX58_MANES